ncbi:MAG: PQQ-dependent dehydrogenase, methanol/ethanol family, partial [Bauldia sp.]|nr:PQQ-dependent dehydrogenase, methanol/ethanol family [Bauldia sp.]
MSKGATLKLSAGLAAIAAGTCLSGTAFANDDVMALAADPGNVVMPNINYAGWNYSLLDQITLDNVDQLQIAWTWQVGIL